MTGLGKQQNKASVDRAAARARGKTDAKRFVAAAITEGQLDAEVAKLAALPPSVYEASRVTEAKRLNMRVTKLDPLVKVKRDKTTKEQRDFLPHWKVDDWSTPVDGAALLEELRKHFTRYIVLPKHADAVLALWTLHTWVFDCFDIAAYLAITSPTRRCGKTLLMTMLYWLCCRAKKNDSMSKAAIYRSVEAEQPTLILDEVGWVLDPKDDRQGILCGGFERNGFVEVCDGEGANITVRRYSTYCPKAFGLIGKLVPVLMDRSIEIQMQRKLREKVDRLRRRDNDRHAELRKKCLRWANDNRKALTEITPKLPEKLNDRVIDFWEPLLAIAQQASGDWPKLAAEAAIALSGGESVAEEKSIELLADIKRISESSKATEMTTKALIVALCDDEERPWATYNKGNPARPITDRQLAKLLEPFHVLSETIHAKPGSGGKDAKGYKFDKLRDAFERYLTPAEDGQSDASAQIGGSQASERPYADEIGITNDFSIRPESDSDGCEKNARNPLATGKRTAGRIKIPKQTMKYVLATLPAATEGDSALTLRTLLRTFRRTSTGAASHPASSAACRGAPSAPMAA